MINNKSSLSDYAPNLFNKRKLAVSKIDEILFPQKNECSSHDHKSRDI